MLKLSDETCNQIHTFPSFLKVISLTMRDAPREVESINKAGIERVVMPEGGNHLNLWTGSGAVRLLFLWAHWCPN